jgi:two-component system chemotaxis response regulator CheY
MLLRYTLTPMHVVEEAIDGEEGLRKLASMRPDILLVDVAMPIRDGLSVCEAARADPAFLRLGIIVLSAYARENEALAAGADRFLRKPFRPLGLLQAIDELLASRRADTDGPTDQLAATTD